MPKGWEKTARNLHKEVFTRSYALLHNGKEPRFRKRLVFTKGEALESGPYSSKTHTYLPAGKDAWSVFHEALHDGVHDYDIHEATHELFVHTFTKGSIATRRQLTKSYLKDVNAMLDMAPHEIEEDPEVFAGGVMAHAQFLGVKNADLPLLGLMAVKGRWRPTEMVAVVEILARREAARPGALLKTASRVLKLPPERIRAVLRELMEIRDRHC